MKIGPALQHATLTGQFSRLQFLVTRLRRWHRRAAGGAEGFRIANPKPYKVWDTVAGAQLAPEACCIHEYIVKLLCVFCTDDGDVQQAVLPVWDTVAARRWWWPDCFFTPAAAEAAVDEVLAAQPQPDPAADGMAPQQLSAAADQLAARAVVAALVEAPCSDAAGGDGDDSNAADGGSGSSYAAVVLLLVRQHPELSHIADEVHDLLFEM